MNHCIGICGQKQVGKDTVFEILKPILEKNLNKQFIRVAFADEVKNMLCKFRYIDNKHGFVKVTREFIEDNKNKEDIPNGWNMNIRDAMNNIGDRFREICPNIWIHLAFLQSTKEGKIVTDVRYPNEAFFIKNDMKGINIKVLRNEVYKNDGHRSETSLLEYDKKIPQDFEGFVYLPESPYDYILRNDGNREELEIKVNTQLAPFILKKWKYFI
jgi:hypothetical protein